jgi:hypothetical protein
MLTVELFSSEFFGPGQSLAGEPGRSQSLWFGPIHGALAGSIKQINDESGYGDNHETD